MDTSKNVVRLKIKNFMSISDLELKPNKITEIVGQNSQGKTTVLKAIETAFKGSTNGQLVKHGADQAEILIELPDQVTIRRVIKAKGGQTLNVKRGEFTQDAPQEYLKALVDYNAFNPVDLLDPKVRKEAILNSIDFKVTADLLREKLKLEAGENLPPVNFEQHGLKVLNQVYEYIYNRRAEANTDAKNKKNEFEVKSKDFTTIAPPTVSRQEVEIDRMTLNQEISAIKSQMQMAETLVKQNEEAVKKHEKYKGAVQSLKLEKESYNKSANEEIAALEIKLEKLREALKATNDVFNQRIEDGEKYVADAAAEIKTVPDLEPFKKELAAKEWALQTLKQQETAIDAFEQNQRASGLLNDLKAKYTAAQEFADKLTWRLEQFATIKSDLMAAADLPIAGLKFVDDEIYIGNTPIDLISTADSVELAVGVAKTQAKKTKIICIDKFESLTPETRKMFLEKIKDDDFTYFMTVAGEADDGVDAIKMQNGAAV